MRLLTLLACFTLLQVAVSIQWLSLAMSASTNARETNNCSKDNGLVRKQRKLCAKYIEFMTAVKRGARGAIHECQYQFKHRRWNCSTRRNVHGKSKFFVNKGTRESAFIHALSSAAVSHAVTKACSRGKLTECGCDKSDQSYIGSTDGDNTASGQQKFRWAGCSDNVRYGNAFSKTFVDARERIKNSNHLDRTLMNLHNNNAGRQVIASNMQVKCKCHGVSGSCELKTCWRATPTLRTIGDSLKKRFDGATMVLLSSKTSYKMLVPQNKYFKYQSANDLVYLKKSPDFCVRNKKLGSKGTKGRLCKIGSKGVEGCDIMCCDRGYYTRIRHIVERCNCKFQWCCSVKCDTCRVKVIEHICK